MHLKGKSRNPYEFGVKVGLAMTLKGNLIVGARSFTGNPYDGHTLAEQIEQSTILMQNLDVQPEVAYVDLGYRGVDQDNLQKFRSSTGQGQGAHRRRAQTVQATTGHRAHHRTSEGRSPHGPLPPQRIRGRCPACSACAAGYNIRWLLRMIVKKGLGLCCACFKLWDWRRSVATLAAILALTPPIRRASLLYLDTKPGPTVKLRAPPNWIRMTAPTREPYVANAIPTPIPTAPPLSMLSKGDSSDGLTQTG